MSVPPPNAFRNSAKIIRKKISFFKKHAKQAIQRRTVSIHTPPHKLNNFVFSPGGVATTALMQHLENFLNINDYKDRDGLKHPPFPPLWICDTHRVLFLTGPVQQIEASLVRRGWRVAQGAKLGSLGAVLLPGAIGRWCLRRAVRHQINVWQAYAVAHPDRVLVISFDEIWSEQQKIAAFFGITDPLFIQTFPQRRDRHSK